MELLVSAANLSVLLLVLVAVAALSTLAGIAVAVIIKSLGPPTYP